MNVIIRQEILQGALNRVREQANTGLWTGQIETAYFENCRWYIERYECIILFTRDTGYHSSGWWKNPDYERCYHLSLSFQGERKRNITEKIVKGLFGDNQKLLWIEPPYSKIGKQKEVWHYRLFCDALWNPIKPRGEVYNTEFTEKGWKSFSEVHGDKE
jgi:hypothetical protein